MLKPIISIFPSNFIWISLGFSCILAPHNKRNDLSRLDDSSYVRDYVIKVSLINYLINKNLYWRVKR